MSSGKYDATVSMAQSEIGNNFAEAKHGPTNPPRTTRWLSLIQTTNKYNGVCGKISQLALSNPLGNRFAHGASNLRLTSVARRSLC